MFSSLFCKILKIIDVIVIIDCVNG
jgi:hypothetical protein